MERGIMEWIVSVPGDDKKEYCTYCKSNFHCHHGELLRKRKVFKFYKFWTSFKSFSSSWAGNFAVT